MFLRWLARRKEARDYKSFIAGFDYACGAAIRGEITLEDLNEKARRGVPGLAETRHSYHFDRGVRVAVQNLIDLDVPWSRDY